MRSIVAAVALATVLVSPVALAITLPSGFTSETIAGGFDKPVGIAPTSDGRIFVTEKKGLLWLIKNGVKGASPILDLRAEVNKEADRGLLGVTLHPNFPSTPYIYLLYTHDNVAGTSHQGGEEAVLQRLVRYSVVGDTLDTSTRKILLGNNASDSPALCFSSHGVDTVRFGLDGSLLVSTGDGAHWDFVDAGQDATSSDPSCRNMYGAAQDIGAFRAQSLDSLAGKILRIDPETGLGLPSNPFWDGNAASIRSRIWARGFKNPFRFGLKAGTAGPGSIYVGDVGTDLFEEIDLVRGGENFGWPCFEGPNPMPGYQNDSRTKDKCAQLPLSQTKIPLYSSAHNHTNRATGGVIQYNGNSYPSKYKGAFFITDYAQSFIKVLKVDGSENLVGVEDFATNADNPVDLEIDPKTGDILYTAITAGEVRRLRFSSANQPPQVSASASPTGGAAPLTVKFSSNGTMDPEGDTLSFDWDFGDSTTHSTEANPTHVYSKSGSFSARLTVNDGHGNSASATVKVSTTNAPPTVSLANPPDGYVFTDGEQIQFRANASDPNGDALSYQWEVRLVHAAHVHFDLFSSTLQTPPPFTASSHGTGERYSYLVLVTVTDPGGLSATAQAHFLPKGLTNAAPSASFTASPQTGPRPLTVSFDSAGSSDPDGDLLEAGWEFGDGTTASGAQVTHTYDATGSFTARLTVTDIFGAKSSTSRTIQVQSSGTAPGGLVARWPLDEGAGSTAGDVSGNGFTGTITAGSWTTGRSGKALLFDGSTTRVRVASSAKLSVTGQVTVAAWVKLTDPAKNTYMRIVTKKPTWSSTEGYSLSYNPSKKLLEVHGSGSDQAQASGVALDTGWHHLAATIDGGSAHLYVDGKERTSDGTVTPLVAGSSALTLGADSGGNLFQGALDDVQIYGKALSASEIAALAGGSAPPPPPASSAVAVWAFDEGAGAVAADEVNALPCTLAGTSWTGGKQGTALAFAGSSSSTNCGRPSALAFSADATVAVWVKIADPNQSTYMRLVSSKSSWDATSGLDLSYNPGRDLLEFHGSGPDGATAKVALDTGWHHLAAVVKGTSVRLYVDGVDRTSDSTASALVPATVAWRLGRDGAGNPFTGALDQLRFYNRALSAAEVASLASGGTP